MRERIGWHVKNGSKRKHGVVGHKRAALCGGLCATSRLSTKRRWSTNAHSIAFNSTNRFHCFHRKAYLFSHSYMAFTPTSATTSSRISTSTSINVPVVTSREKEKMKMSKKKDKLEEREISTRTHTRALIGVHIMLHTWLPREGRWWMLTIQFHCCRAETNIDISISAVTVRPHCSLPPSLHPPIPTVV